MLYKQAEMLLIIMICLLRSLNPKAQKSTKEFTKIAFCYF
jgi:hypothetical protein